MATPTQRTSKKTHPHNSTHTAEMSPSCNSLAGRWIAARESVGLSQTELAEQLGIHKGSVSRIETGNTTSLNGDTLIAMELVTHHRGLWIMRGEGPRYISDDPTSLLVKQLAVEMTPDQLRRAIELSTPSFTPDDIKALVALLVDTL